MLTVSVQGVLSQPSQVKQILSKDTRAIRWREISPRSVLIPGDSPAYCYKTKLGKHTVVKL